MNDKDRNTEDIRRIKFADMPAFARASLTVGGLDLPVALVTLHWFECRKCDDGIIHCHKEVKVYTIGKN
jgi:hypothetical protein